MVTIKLDTTALESLAERLEHLDLRRRSAAP
jgi:hypothetical protein